MDSIEYRKELNAIYRRARNKIPKICALCGKNITSFCNSHSVPQMFLKNIASNGKVYNPSHIMGNMVDGGIFVDSSLLAQVIDDELGVNKAGTFHIICKSCDSKIFQDYEIKELWESDKPLLDDNVLAKIVLKNNLHNYYQRYLEYILYRDVKNEIKIL